jgi:hypothetical protein
MKVLTSETMNIIQGKYVKNGFTLQKSSHRAVFSSQVHPDCSNKYVPIMTSKVFASLIANGVTNFEWEILKQDKTKGLYPETKPMIVAIYIDLTEFGLESLGKFALYIINSSNGKKKFRLAYGFLNGACLNGCIWGNILSDLETKHYGPKAREIDADIQKTVVELKNFIYGAALKKELDMVKELQATTITQATAEKIAKQAFDLRFQMTDASALVSGEEPTHKVSILDLPAITQSHRPEFAELNLWNLYQTVHENLGGNFDHATRKSVPKVRFQLLTNDAIETPVGKPSSIRNCNGINEKVKFNIELMDIVKKALEEEKIAA